MSARTLASKGGGLLDPRSHIGWKRERSIRVWKPLPSRDILKTLMKNSKRTISSSGGLELLQLITSRGESIISIS